MVRKRQAQTKQLKNPGKIIVAEGEVTEKMYFEHILNKNTKQFLLKQESEVFTVACAKHSTPDALIKKAKKWIGQKYNLKKDSEIEKELKKLAFFVCDKDRHNFTNVKNKGYRIFVTSPFFELYLLNHFECYSHNNTESIKNKLGARKLLQGTNKKEINCNLITQSSLNKAVSNCQRLAKELIFDYRQEHTKRSLTDEAILFEISTERTEACSMLHLLIDEIIDISSLEN